MLQHTADGAYAMSCLQVVFDLQTLVHLSGVVTQARIRHSWVLTLPPRGYSEPVGYSQYPRSSTCRAWLRRHGSHSHGGEHTPRSMHSANLATDRAQPSVSRDRGSAERSLRRCRLAHAHARTHRPAARALQGDAILGKWTESFAIQCGARVCAYVAWLRACVGPVLARRSPRRYSAAVLRGYECVARRPTCAPG